MITVAGTVIADFFARILEDEPSRGSLMLIEEIGFHLGGATPNTRAVLARLGVPISVVRRIGNDPFWSLVRQQLEKWAHTVTLAIDLQRQTTSVLGHTFADGERSFLYSAGASAAFCALDLDLRHEQARIEGLALGLRSLAAATGRSAHAAGLLTGAGARILGLLDVGYYPGLDWRTLRDLLPFVDIFRPNTRGAEAITGESQPEVAAGTPLEHGVRQFVAIKGGERALTYGPPRRRVSFIPVIK
jgi:sugar/nucleoside kinase (ribokinase family)